MSAKTRLTVGGVLLFISLVGGVLRLHGAIADDVRVQLVAERTLSAQSYVPRDDWHETREDMRELATRVEALTREIERLRASVEALPRRFPHGR